MLRTINADAFDAPPAAARTINLKLPTRRPLLIDAVTLRPTGYTNNTQELLLTSVIDEVQIIQDGLTKSRFKPTLMRLLDDFLNSNADTLDISKIYLPFNHYLNPNTGWGVGNINELLLRVICSTTFPANTTFTALQAQLAVHEIDAPVNRGNVILYGVLPQAVPVAGWNEIPNLPYYGVRNLSKLLLNHAAITAVEVWLDDNDLKYQKTKEDQLFHLRINPLYKVPSTCTHTAVAGQSVSSTGPFPVFFDDFGLTGDTMSLFDSNGNRRRLKIKYFWDTNITAVAAFDILASGIEQEVQSQGGTTNGRA